MDKEIINKIEEKAAKLINLFCSEMEQCKNEMEYMDLIAASMVFRNLILNHFKDALRQDLNSEEEIELIINSMLLVSDDISKNVVANIDFSKKEISIKNIDVN